MIVLNYPEWRLAWGLLIYKHRPKYDRFFFFNFLAWNLVESIFRAAKRFIYMRVLLEYLKEFSLELQLWNCGKGSRCGAVAIPLFETIFDWNDCRN